MSRVLENQDRYNFDKAKQRASMKWLLSKAYNHQTPEELKEPFYKDHDDAERLKPHIVRSLANAELYCMALSVLYADPNFHNLNHWGIIQALARKGISVAEPSDCSLTETVLIQTTPLKMSAHMAVIEALMQLFIKEQVSVDKVLSTVKRFSAPVSVSDAPTDPESALLLWTRRCCDALKEQIEASPQEQQEAPPKFPKISDLSDLTDGVAITSVMALYCPDGLPASSIALGDPPTMADSLYNIQLLQRFCKDCLPFNFCHLTIEDLVYLHDSIRQNVVCFMADLFTGLEVKPVIRSIQLPGVKKDRIIDIPDPEENPAITRSQLQLRSFNTSHGQRVAGAIPDLRPSLDCERTTLITDLHRKNSPVGLKRFGITSSQEASGTRDESFVVQKGRNVPTLANVLVDKSDKEQYNKDTKSEELGEVDHNASSSDVFQQMKNIPVAGRPSDTPVRRPSRSFSRRNSVDDNASSLCLENLGGSQDNLSLLGRNPDKEMRTHTGRRESAAADSTPNNDRYLDNREVEEMERRQRESMSPGKAQNFVRMGSEGPQDKVSFADLRKQKARDQFHSSGINITYTEQEKEDTPKKSALGLLSRRESQNSPSATAVNASPAPDAMAAQLNSVRLKLEQRRKRIEEEKRKMESVMAKQREKSTNNVTSPTASVASSAVMGASDSLAQNQTKHERPLSLKDLTEDLSAVQSRWLSDRSRSLGEPKTPDVEGMDMDTYSKSIYAMNDSLHDLQNDIHRIAAQQSQIQQLMHSPSAIHQRPPNPMDPQPFYISQPDPPPQRRTWGQPQPIAFAHQQPGGGMDWPQQPPRRAQWGTPQPPPSQRPPQQPPVMYDPYSGAPIDQWGYPYNGYQGYTSAYNNPTYAGGYGQPYGYAPPQAVQQPPQQPMTPTTTPTRTPFRLHEDSKAHSAPPRASTLPRRQSESYDGQVATSSPMRPSYSRQASRDTVTSSSPILPPRRPHTSVPAPEEDEMAPQSVSFIDSSADDEEVPAKRISQLNITSGSKTYRVHGNSQEKEPSPSPTRTRPTLSSAFKHNRRGSSGEGLNSGPSSLRSNSGGVLLTEEEAEMLAAMKTEKLKDDADASKGFVISFENDTPKKPKPQLKQRRLSSKKNSLAGQSEMSSDGSNSSRKENVPPGLMICIDMGDESGGSNDMRTYSRGRPRNGSTSADHWRSYDPEPVSSDQDSPAIPKFEVDPNVPLENMEALDHSDQSESDGGGRLNTGLIIGDELLKAKDPAVQDEMQRKKEKIMMQSLRRKQQAEENRLRKLDEERQKREEEAKKEDDRNRKKEEEKARREAILEQHRLKKEIDHANEEGLRMPEPISAKPVPKLRAKSANKPVGAARPRPKTIHVDQDADVNAALSSRGTRGSISNISGGKMARSDSRNSINNDHHASGGLSLASMGTGRLLSTSASRAQTPSRRGSSVYIGGDDSAGLPPTGPSSPGWANRPTPTVRRKPSNVSTVSMSEDSPRMSRMDRSARSMSQPRGKRDSSVSSAYGGGDMQSRGYRGSRESLHSGMTYSARRGSNASVYDQDDYYYGGSMRDLSNRHGNRRKSSSASHLDISTRSAAMGSLRSLSHLNSLRRNQMSKSRSFANLSGPGSLPGYARRRGDYDDGASDISSTSGFGSAYGYRSGSRTRLYREPTVKSNRTIVLNAIEYVVFPGVVNAETRNRVLDVIDRCDCPHFLLLFRDAKCQFRGLYAYYPDTEEVYKIYGTGPKQVTENMYETFFKYNSGGKKFTKIHTKHLTVTIDAFTIHNALWLGKKAKLPDKRDMALVV